MNWSNIQSQRVRELPFAGIRKVFEAASRLEAAGKDVIHLEMGRPDFDTPEHIKNAAKAALDAGDVHYTSNYGTPRIREAISQKMKRRGVDVDIESQIIVTVGAAEAMFDIFGAFVEPGDEVIVPQFCWGNYRCVPTFFGAKAIGVPLHEQRRFNIDPADVEALISPRTKAIVLNSPHNPTGAVYDRVDLESIGALAKENGILIISDEIYEDLTYDGTASTCIASLPGLEDVVLTVSGFSKAYSMDGWRLGYVVGHERLIQAVIKIHQYNTACASSFVQAGGVEALTASQDCVGNMRDELQRRRDLVVSRLNAMPGIKCVEPKGAFYVFPNISGVGIGAVEFAERLLNEYGVAVVPGSTFGPGGDPYVRVSFAALYERLEEAMDRLEAFVAKLA